MILLGVPAAVLLAIVALLVMAGAYLLGTWLSKVASQAPWPVSWLVGGLASFSRWAVAGIWSILAGAFHAALAFLKYPFEALRIIGDPLVGGLESAAAAIARVATAVRVAFDHVVAYAAAAVTTLRGEVAAQVGHVWDALQADYHQALQYASTLYDDALGALATSVAALDGAIAATWHATTAAIAGTREWAAGLVGSVAGALEGEIARTAGAIDAGVDQLAHRVTTAVHDVYDGLTGEINATRADALAYTEGVAGAITGYLAGTLAPAVTATATEVDECLKPYCEGMKGVGATLNAIAAGLELAALLAFLEQAIAEPAHVVTVVEDVAGPTAQGAYDLIRVAVGFGA